MPVMDPFIDSSNPSLLDRAISLLPKTFMKNENTCEKWKQGDYPGVLQALAVNTSKDRLDQARIVLASNSELQNSGVPQSMQTTCEDRAIPPMVKNRERRPGLGFKHARFSLRPSTSSQPSLDVDKSFDIGKYPDAEDFFAAYEKHERAEMELRKLRGEISTDFTQQELARKTRIRRPGLSGRIAHYKHYNYSSDVGDLNERFGSSQKTSEMVIPSPSNGIMDLEITDKHGPSQEKGVAGGGRMDSVAEPKNKVDCLLDEILINDCTTLDRDGLSNLLEEQLQIRPMEKFDLPLLGRVRKSDDNISLEQLGRSMKLSSSTQNMTERVKDKGSIERRKLSINSTSSPDSPTPSRSPLSSISLAARHFTLADRPDNTFSFTFGLDDISPVRDLTHAVGVEKGAPSPHIDSGSKLDEANRNGLSFSEKFEAMIQEKNLSDGNTVDKLVTEDSAHSVDAVDYNQSEICNDTNLKTCDVGLEDKVEDMQQIETMGTEKNPVINDKVVDKPVTENSAYSVDLVDDNNIEHMDHSGHGLEDKIEDMGQERMASDQAELETMKNTQCLGTVGNVSGPCVDTDAPHVEASILPEPNNETHQERPRNVLNVQSKQKAPVHNKRQGHKDENKQKAPMRNKRKREVSYRKSLAGAGIQWQDGVRRSTRKRVRPLEFWKGEQFLYGRVHDSLVTVVGCKYASSPKGKAEPTLKVESFVSNRYKVRFPSLF